MQNRLTLVNLTIITIAISCLIFSLSVMFIERQYEQLATNDELKLALVSEQIRARIDIFQENRAKALELIAQNWPATHPNLGLWFNQQSLDFIQLLSQVNSIWYVSTSWDTQWRVPAISQQRQITQYIDLTPYQEDSHS